MRPYKKQQETFSSFDKTKYYGYLGLGGERCPVIQTRLDSGVFSVPTLKANGNSFNHHQGSFEELLTQLRKGDMVYEFDTKKELCIWLSEE